MDQPDIAALQAEIVKLKAETQEQARKLQIVEHDLQVKNHIIRELRIAIVDSLSTLNGVKNRDLLNYTP